MGRLLFVSFTSAQLLAVAAANDSGRKAEAPVTEAAGTRTAEPTVAVTPVRPAEATTRVDPVKAARQAVDGLAGKAAEATARSALGSR